MSVFKALNWISKNVKVRSVIMNVLLVIIFVTHQNGMEIAVWPLLCVRPK